MKKIGLLVAVLSLASSAIYAGTRLFNKTKNTAVKTVKAVKKAGSEINNSTKPSQSSISRSYTYVAEDF